MDPPTHSLPFCQNKFTVGCKRRVGGNIKRYFSLLNLNERIGKRVIIISDFIDCKEDIFIKKNISKIIIYPYNVFGIHRIS